jgi:hypothetical protein
MANQILCELPRVGQANRLQAGEQRKPANWLRSIETGLFMAVCLFVVDWYILSVADWCVFSAVDGNLTSLRLIDGALNRVRDDSEPWPTPRSSDKQLSRGRAASLFVPVRSIPEAKVPTN